ncbi:tetratricopeptide repeat protein [Pedobacter frigidisoli]|uniref:tetratricopeptide repeat protein n=1 Tax=Pedobacter frigidisoli TaxID=2530455 RepID=UPI0029312140|nr:tetratricopeptide repeat protein [Pedobacter frigidisoli]
MAKKLNDTNKLIQDGENLFKLGEIEGALKCFDKVLENFPNNISALRSKAWCLFKLKKQDQARIYFEAALKIDDCNAESWTSLGSYFLLRKEIEDANNCFKKAEVLEGTETSFSQMAHYLYSNEEYDKAALYVGKALSINDKSENALNTKGLLYTNSKEYNEAIKTFEFLIGINSYTSMYYNNLGYAYFLNKRIEKAISTLNRSITLDPSNAYPYNNLSVLYQNQSDLTTAWNFIELAISKDSDIPEFWLNKGDLLIALIKSGDKSRGDFNDVGYFLSRANRSAIDIIIALNSMEAALLKNEKDQIIRGMINMDIFYAETTRNCKVDNEDYLTIYRMSLEIVALLNASEEEEFHFAHYTTQDTANALIFKNSSFRLHSVTTANDPKEGYPLLNFLGFTGSFPPSIYQAFVGSFTFNPDSLNQFRLYGKNNNIEGSGVSLILSFKYFGEDANINHGLVSANKWLKPLTKQPLFRCVYIDPISRRVISLGHKEACTFYREDLSADKKDMDKKANKYLQFIDEQKHKVEEALDLLNSEIHNAYDRIENDFDKKNEIFKIIPLLLIHLRYLIKHYDFKEEQECRVIQVEPLINNSRITVTDDNSRMYVNYLSFHNDSVSYLKNVYWGPKTSNFDLFKDRVTLLGMNIQCFINDHPFN